jgi:hypothetical protein
VVAVVAARLVLRVVAVVGATVRTAPP